jgi:hypothetical protein
VEGSKKQSEPHPLSPPQFNNVEVENVAYAAEAVLRICVV